MFDNVFWRCFCFDGAFLCFYWCFL